jgi:hypothetical protein
MPIKRTQLLLSSALIASVALSQTAIAKEASDKNKPKSIQSILKDKTANQGFLNLYQDEETGSLMALIDEESLNKPFLHFTHTVNSPIEAGQVTGTYRVKSYIEFRKVYDKIEVIKRPSRYKFDPKNAISRAKESNQSIAIWPHLKLKLAIKRKNNSWLTSIAYYSQKP